MRVHIEYDVILTIDIPKGSNVLLGRIKPTMVKYPKFKVTEDKSEDDYYAKHRKYVGRITAKEAEELFDNEFSRIEHTMGVITFEGLKPAVSFDTESDSCYMNAYVSPVIVEEEELVAAIAKLPTEYDREQVLDKARKKYDQCLNLLYDFYHYHKVAKSFHVNTNQLHLQF